jgi:hypothetical protein
MRQFIKDAWEVLKERYKTRKAMRLLCKQEWSVDFLTALLIRAARISKQNLELELVSPLGQRIIIRSTDPAPRALADDSIFDHLDDEAKLQAFMREVNRK